MLPSQEDYASSVAAAKAQLRPLDRVRVKHCGGVGTFTFLGWTGPNNSWLDTASGHDLHPYNIVRVNGHDATFR